MRVLVTGAFGNIGASTLPELLNEGHQVRGFDLDTKRNREVARDFEGRVETVFGDVAREEDVLEAVEGCDAVIHDAAVACDAGRIVFVGTERELRAKVRLREGAASLDAAGGTVLPGFVDAHTHLPFAGWRERAATPEARARTKLVVGPWTHSAIGSAEPFGDVAFGPSAAEDVPGLALRP